MPKRKIVETKSAAAGVRNDSVPAGETVLVAVPRTWLIALPAIVLVPWLIAAGIYAWGARNTAGQAAGAGTAGDAASAPGDQRPWGQLEIRPIVISPPLELLPTNWGPIAPPQWRFPDADRLQIEEGGYALDSGSPNM